MRFSPQNPNLVIFPKSFSFQSHVQSQACNYGYERQTINDKNESKCEKAL